MQYTVPLIAQTTGMSCWAASIAMVLGWKNDASYDPTLIAANNGGPGYMPAFENGLDPNDQYILRRNGFQMDAPQCYSLAAVTALLDASGPLWVASAVPEAHVRVVTGYDGQQLLINDPAPVGAGSRYTASFNEIFGQMEALGARERRQANPVYVAYMAS